MVCDPKLRNPRKYLKRQPTSFILQTIYNGITRAKYLVCMIRYSLYQGDVVFRKVVTILPFIISFACARMTPIQTAEEQLIETQATVGVEEAIISTSKATVAPIYDYAIFSINVQDFSCPKQSVAVLDRIISLHEACNIPVDICLTDGMAEITTFVNEMNQYSFVRWANIEETAQAWVEAGSVPSRIEME